MKLEEIYKPISRELAAVEENIRRLVKADEDSLDGAFEYFYGKPGKFLRPAAAILSARAVSAGNLSPPAERQLIDLAAAVELIHSTSLIHDDVIDEETIRRGRLSMNREYGNKAAVLAGDFLFIKAFTLSLGLPAEIIRLLCEATRQMCTAEFRALGRVEELNGDYSAYLKMIEDKTASFFSASCKTGAMLAGGRPEEVKSLADYGLYLGMAYQIQDDISDGDRLPCEKTSLFLGKYPREAAAVLQVLAPSVYKEKLEQLLGHICSYTGRKKGGDYAEAEAGINRRRP